MHIHMYYMYIYIINISYIHIITSTANAHGCFRCVENIKQMSKILHALLDAPSGATNSAASQDRAKHAKITGGWGNASQNHHPSLLLDGKTMENMRK